MLSLELLSLRLLRLELLGLRLLELLRLELLRLELLGLILRFIDHLRLPAFACPKLSFRFQSHSVPLHLLGLVPVRRPLLWWCRLILVRLASWNGRAALELGQTLAVFFLKSLHRELHFSVRGSLVHQPTTRIKFLERSPGHVPSLPSRVTYPLSHFAFPLVVAGLLLRLTKLPGEFSRRRCRIRRQVVPRIQLPIAPRRPVGDQFAERRLSLLFGTNLPQPGKSRCVVALVGGQRGQVATGHDVVGFRGDSSPQIRVGIPELTLQQIRVAHVAQQIGIARTRAERGQVVPFGILIIL